MIKIVRLFSIHIDQILYLGLYPKQFEFQVRIKFSRDPNLFLYGANRLSKYLMDLCIKYLCALQVVLIDNAGQKRYCQRKTQKKYFKQTVNKIIVVKI